MSRVLTREPDGAPSPGQRLRAPAIRRRLRPAAHRATWADRVRLRRREVSLPTARVRAAIIGLLTRERAMPVAVAALVLAASILSVPAGTLGGASIGNASGPGAPARITVAGLEGRGAIGAVDVAGPEVGSDGPSEIVGEIAVEPGSEPIVPEAPTVDAGLAARLDPVDTSTAAVTVPEGPFLEDGTLLKPLAVDTSVPDASDDLRTYKVRSGDTLTGIARRFGVSMMTIWWANKLSNKDDLTIGRELVIPPVNGLVWTVREGETVGSIAAAAGASAERIIEYNKLTEPTVIIGQVLIIPGGKGAPIPTPKPVAKASAPSRSTTSSSRSTTPPSRYTGGAFGWPVAGGYISQYYHYGHYGLDIAADYGTRVRSGAGGVVTYAGWKSNGGGYQVWVAHGSGLYTTYNHMSAISVGRGQRVSRGQQVGRIGTSGYATGPHLHFEVWRGYPWGGGSRRVNPLGYL